MNSVKTALFCILKAVIYKAVKLSRYKRNDNINILELKFNNDIYVVT